MLIRSAAYFEVCEDCSSHGSIVLAGGVRRREVVSKEEALREMESCKLKSVVAKEEIPELRRQILTSPLPRRDEELSPKILSCKSILDRLIDFVEQEETDKFLENEIPKGIYLPNVRGTA